MGIFGFFSKDKKDKLDKGLEKSKESIVGKLSRAVAGKSKVDEDFLDNLEEILISADVGVATTVKIIERLEERVARDKFMNMDELNSILKEEISGLFDLGVKSNPDFYANPERKIPFVMLIVGVNGVGKTTTIGKLASQLKSEGKKVVIGAADTFRAAAVEQIEMWGSRIDVPVISHGMGKDPASVAFDTVKRAVDEKADIVLIDTAGRLHNKVNLMNELSKIKRVIQKFIPEAPQEVLLVLDGSTGQNALNQAQEFTKATQVTGIAITKLDGTAKGGVVLGIADQMQIPLRYIGVGEGVEDLQVFNASEYVDSLLG
ncbi:signal recognition particle-docking protein FtsY [Hyphobacterium sp. CCMP332]|nr:signal recognition particle-docking protein FtsY [Hyphobacterium sp. CCMP332]